MHPKRLLDICIDAFVQLTRDIQMSDMSDKEKFLAVNRMWDELWMLPQNIPIYAGELLHAYLLLSTGQDFCLGFFIALAAKLRRITIHYNYSCKLPLRHASTYDACYFHSQEYFLQELDISGVEGEIDTSILEEILPKCPSLKILKLGVNANKAVLLLAKKHCPLTVLHMLADPLMVHQMKENGLPRSSITLDIWMDVFFGVTNVHPTKILEGIRKGESYHLKASWPNLTDLNTGHFELPDEFFVLVGIIYKKLTYVFSNVTSVVSLGEKYMYMKSEVPELRRLTIGEFNIYSRDIAIETEGLLRVASSIEYFGLLMDSNPDEHLYENFERLANASLYPMGINYIHAPSIKRGIFSLLGKQTKKLLIEGMSNAKVDLKELGEFLSDFPSLEQLTLSFNCGLTCHNENFVANLCFPKVTSLIIKTSVEQITYNVLFKMFPNLHEIMFFGPREGAEQIHISFKKLSELRILKVADWNWVHFSDIFDIPRYTQKNPRYELHGPSDILSNQDIRKFINSGWNYFPKSKSTLEVECKIKTHW